MNTDNLIMRLKEKADKLGISAKYPPLDAAAIAECERQMKVRLPPLFKQIYTTVSNGGIGPNEALLELKGLDSEASDDGESEDEEIYGLYQAWINDKTVIEDFDDEDGDVVMEWISGVLPTAYWGCNVYTLLDCNNENGMMIYSDLTGANVNFKKEWKRKASSVFDRPGVPFVDWVSSWLDDEEQKKYIPGSGKFLQQSGEKVVRDVFEDLKKLRKEAVTLEPAELFERAQNLINSSPTEACELYQIAAAKGHKQAQQWIIDSVKKGDEFGYHWDLAYEYAGENVDRYPFYIDSPGFMSMMKGKYLHDWSVVAHFWEKRMKFKDARAAYSLGWAKDNGFAEYVKTSGSEAYRLAAEWGDKKAQVKIQQSLPAEEREGLDWLTQAATIDDTAAQYKLWLHYSQNGDQKNALKYLKLAAKTRSADQETVDGAKAMIDFARLLTTGEYEVKLDAGKAIKLLERASKRIPGESSLQLGLLYKNHIEKRDQEKALKWFRHGSERGNIECFYQLGLIYEEAGNLARAATVLKIAADQGFEPAAARLADIRARTGAS